MISEKDILKKEELIYNYAYTRRHKKQLNCEYSLDDKESTDTGCRCRVDALSESGMLVMTTD
jgi:SET domain-containing protein